MKKLFYLLFLAGALSFTSAQAQRNFFSIQYSMGFGTGDTKSFVSASSFRGADIQIRKMLQPSVGVGIDAGWNVFYERRPYDTYTSGNTALSGVQYRYINAVPLYAAVDYYFSPGEKINPFVGLGIGTLYTSRDVDMGLFTTNEDAWAFALRPEAGILMDASPEMSFILVAKYNSGFSTSDLAAQTYFTLGVGLVFKKQ